MSSRGRTPSCVSTGPKRARDPLPWIPRLRFFSCFHSACTKARSRSSSCAEAGTIRGPKYLLWQQVETPLHPSPMYNGRVTAGQPCIGTVGTSTPLRRPWQPENRMIIIFTYAIDKSICFRAGPWVGGGNAEFRVKSAKAVSKVSSSDFRRFSFASVVCWRRKGLMIFL